MAELSSHMQAVLHLHQIILHMYMSASAATVSMSSYMQNMLTSSADTIYKYVKSLQFNRKNV